MVLLLEDLAVFHAECVEDIKRLAVREANLSLSRDPAPISCVVAQYLNTADRGQNAGEEIHNGSASFDRHTFPAFGLSGVRSIASVAHGTFDTSFVPRPS